jgi:hypothetical protein
MMTRAVFEQSLRQFLDRKPFKPFMIEMDDGSRWQIDRRERLSFYVGDSALYVSPDEELSFLDRDDVRDIVDLPPAMDG